MTDLVEPIKARPLKDLIEAVRRGTQLGRLTYSIAEVNAVFAEVDFLTAALAALSAENRRLREARANMPNILVGAKEGDTP